MKKTSIGTSILFFVTIILVNLVSGCQLSLLEEEQPITIRDNTYTFDSSLSPKLIADGKNDIFPLQTTPSANHSLSTEPVRWNEADFLSIVQSFHQFASQESLANWKLVKMYYNLGCKYEAWGAQSAGFLYYKVVQTENRDRKSRLVHYIFIDASENIASILETEYYPLLDEWPSIDLSKVNITFDDALKIAERNGGAKIREEIGNNCMISASLDSESRYRGWFMTYSSTSDTQISNLLWLDINAQSGEFKKIR